MRCPRCHAPVRAGAAFCVNCGTPTPTAGPSSGTTPRQDQRHHQHGLPAERRRGRAGRAALLAAAGVLLAAATVAATLLVLGPATRTTSPGVAANAAASSATTTADTTGPAPSTTSRPDSTDPSSEEAGAGDAGAQLEDAVEEDSADVDAVSGSWVPQLSSKRPGTVADGFTYTSADILADYQRNRADYPEARLLRSGDWPVFASPDYYVTVAAIAYTSPDQANAWCDAHDLAANDCYAKKLSHTDHGDVTTKHRS